VPVLNHSLYVAQLIDLWSPFHSNQRQIQ